MDIKQCFVCGVTFNDKQFGYWGMSEIKTVYRVSEYKDICNDCTSKANAFVNYYGKKKEKDLKQLRDFLVSGVLVTKKFQSLMNGGYNE